MEEDLASVTASELPWSRLSGKSVLITGASGFLPAYLVESLLYQNEKKISEPTQVIGLVRNAEKARLRFAHYEGRKDLQLIVQDVEVPITDLSRVDVIIHAASHASPKYYGIDPVGTLSANVIGTQNLLSLALKCGAERFLFFSSGEVYGQVGDNQIPTRENDYGRVDPIQVRSCYAESKRMGENMCVSWAHQYGVPSVVVRPFHTYGPGMTLNDGRVYADFVSDILADRDIVMKSDGHARRAFCYLADATSGFFTALFAGKVGEAYNVGNMQAESSILELAQRLIALFPEKQLKVVLQSERHAEADYLQSMISRNCPDITKIGLIGWQPVTTIEEGFSRTVASFL